MDLLTSAEQDEIASVAAGFLRAELPINSIRDERLRPVSFEAALWKRVGDLGWFGLGLDEAHGGTGYGATEEVVLFRELGRHLATGPFVGSVLGARLAALSGNSELVTVILSGDAAVCLGEGRAEQCLVDGKPSGAFDLIDSAGARYALLHGGGSAVLVDLSSGTDVRTEPCIDPGSRLALGDLTGAEVAAVISGEPAADLERRGSLLVASMLCGIAEAARDMAAEYAKVRVQFGRPIGVNQAIKHSCADMAVRAESATSQLFFAAAALAGGRDDVLLQCASAAIIAADAAVENATANIQVHGGMGYTFEHDAHLFLKRARVLERLFGPPSRHLAALLAAPPAS